MDCLFENELAFIEKLGWLDATQFAALVEKVQTQGCEPFEVLGSIIDLSEDQLAKLAFFKSAQQAGNEHSDPPSVTAAMDDKTLVKKKGSSSKAAPSASQKKTDELASDDDDEALKGIDRSRFRILGQLGRGGMGRVYKAYDHHLKRHVAIKILIERDRESVARFIREARAQACVDHEHICKVYEVGQAGQVPYIVMQYIDGRKLDRACEGMTVEQRLLVMKQIAYGVHQAHRMGLIHRDIKPSNVLVAQTEDGRIRPYVLDFGLAKFDFNPETTQIGDVFGTPSFMAPEQALGLHDQVDRRTDVYALGATLYCLLAGRPPVEGSRGAEVLANLQHSEPVPPRKIVSGIPKDVDVMVMKCLSRDPAQRYPSARALAEDLGRFLDGDPIQAKPLGLAYRLRKKVLKHKAFAAMATVAITVSISFLAYMIWSRWQVRERERLATALTERVEEVAAVSRHAHLSPRHDIRPDYRRLEKGMSVIREEMKDAGGIGEGLGNYALGKAHLIMGDWVQAQSLLESAWQSGYQAPRVAHALGMALGERFRHGLEEIQLLADRGDRERRKRELEAKYLQPARKYLQVGAGVAVESPAYLDALLAYYDRDLDRALTILENDDQAPAWFYESLQLKGDIFRELAVRSNDSGDPDAARAAIEKALHAYDRARRIGESDPRIYRSRGKAFLKLMTMGVFSESDLAPFLDKGLAEVAWALEIWPDHWESWLLKAQLHRNMAQQQKVVSKDPIQQIQLAEEAALCALKFPGDRSPIHLELGGIYFRWAQWRNEKRLSPEAYIEKAANHLQLVAPKDQGFTYFHTLGTVAMTRASAQARSGEDAREAYRTAIEMFRNTLTLAPEQFGYYNSLAVCLFRLSELPGIEEPALQLLEEGVDALQTAIEINPNHVVLHYQLGRTYLRMAQNGRPLVGRLDENLVEKALSHFKRALEINPKMQHLYNVLGMTYYFRGIYAWEAGQDHEAWFDQASAIYGQGLELVPNSRRILQNLGWVHYFQGKFDLREGRDPSDSFQRATALSQQAITQGNDLEAQLCLASVERLRAEAAFRLGGNFDKHMQTAMEGIEGLLTMNHNYAEAYRSLGRLHTLDAHRRIQAGLNPEKAFELARSALDKALSLEQRSPYFYLADAIWHLHKVLWLRKQGLPVTELTQSGLASADKSLTLRPEFAEALVVKAALLEMDGAPTKTAEGGEPDRLKLAGLLERNPQLRHQWQNLVRK